MCFVPLGQVDMAWVDEQLAGLGLSLSDLVRYAVVAVLVFVMLRLAWALLTYRRKPKNDPEIDMTIHLAELPQGRAPTEGTVLEFYNMPVRLSGVVIAPGGRATQLPEDDTITWYLCEGVTPQLSHVIRAHEPTIIHWPTQLSVRGFSNAVFRHASLPTEDSGNRRTPWTVVAGIVGAGERTLALALILHADNVHTVRHELIDDELQWRSVLRARISHPTDTDATGTDSPPPVANSPKPPTGTDAP